MFKTRLIFLRTLWFFVVAIAIPVSCWADYEFVGGSFGAGAAIQTTSTNIQTASVGQFGIAGVISAATRNMSIGTLYDLESVVADVVFKQRLFQIINPTGYTGGGAVPGSKIRFQIELENQSAFTAENYIIWDSIPVHTHLYYTGEPPALTGNVTNVVYQGPTSNVAQAVGNEIKFKFDLSPASTATFSYTVTID